MRDLFSRAITDALALVREREFERALARLDQTREEAGRADHEGRIELVTEINRALAVARRKREQVRAQLDELTAGQPEPLREQLDAAFGQVLDAEVQSLRARKRELSRPGSAG